MMSGKLTIIIFFCFLSSWSQIDSTANKWELGTYGGIGHIWPHVSKVRYLQTAHVYHQELYFSFVPNGSKAWHHRFNYSRYGILASFSDFGNPEVGKAYSIVPFYNFTLVRQKKSWLALRFGLGLGYLTEKWDKENNYKNIIIGSNLNASVDLTLNYQYAILPHIILAGALSLGHFSNAKYAAPNTGINYPKFLLGLNYRSYRAQNWKKNAREEFKRKWRQEVNFGVGVKENIASDNNKYFSANITYSMGYEVTDKSIWGLALDFIHDSGKMRLAKAEANIYYDNVLLYTALGVGLVYQLKVHHTQFLFQAGTYLLNKHIIEEDIYNRMAIRQYIAKRLGVHIGIRNHRVNAQTFEAGLVYHLK